MQILVNTIDKRKKYVFIKGVIFKLNPSKKQKFAGEKTKESLKTLVETTGCDTIILDFRALQNTLCVGAD